MRISHLTELLRDNIVDVNTLVSLLDISIEDILERFPDQIKDREEYIVAFIGESDVEDST